MTMSKEDVFMDMMEEKNSIVKLMDKNSILKRLIHLTTRTVHRKDGDRFHSSCILEVN